MSTGIEWADLVWNPTTGCDKVSPGCDHCYALTMAKRLKGMGQAKYQTDGDPRTSGPGFGVAVHPGTLAMPLGVRKPQRIFVNSMSDLFHPRVPAEFIGRVFAVMEQASQHTFIAFTKRAPRMRAWVNRHQPVPLPNVILGVSVENPEEAARRIPNLLDTPAAVRAISAEPLLERVSLQVELLVGRALDPPEGIGWVIAGGESGGGARPCEIGWLRLLRDQCEAVGVPFFCKQFGAVLGRQFGAGAHGDDWDFWPEDLRVREHPFTPAGVAA